VPGASRPRQLHGPETLAAAAGGIRAVSAAALVAPGHARYGDGTMALVADELVPSPAAPAALVRSTDDLRSTTDRSRDRLLLGGLLALAAVLRLPTVGRAYWIDEGISIGIASHPLGQIPHLLRLDGSPPLYYLLLHVWLRAFGASEVSTHLMTILLSLALVPLAWWSGRTLFGRAAGECAAALAATSPFLAWYATETRMYPLVADLALVAVTMAVRATQTGSRRDGAVALVAFGLLLYTHNWALYLVVATGACLGVSTFYRRSHRELLRVAAGCAALAVVYLPWLSTFLAQARHTAAPWAVRPPIGHLLADPFVMFGGTLAVLVGPVLVLGVVATWAGGRSAGTRLTAGLLGSIGALVVLQGWVAAQVEPSWAGRYLTIAMPPLLLAIAGVLGPSRRGRQVVLGTAAVLSAWIILGDLLPNPNAAFAKDNMAAVAAAADHVLRPGDLVVVTQTEQLALARHYLPSDVRFATPLGVVSDPGVVDWRNLISRLEAAQPCTTLGPWLAALPIGAHVLVINPRRTLGATGTRWRLAVNHQVAEVNHLLLAAPALVAVGSFARASDRPIPFSPIVGILFEKTRELPVCPSS